MGKIDILKNFSIVIFAAGVGKRLGPIGKQTPKCLLKIKNEEILLRTIKILKNFGSKKINIIVGYKSKKIKKFIKFNRIKNINFIKIRDYRKNGHAYTWYKFKKYWLVNRKKLLFLHSDILFDNLILKNLILEKKENIIGIHSKNINKLKNYNLVVSTHKHKNLIKEIGYKENIKKPFGEIIGINKFSIKTSEKIFHFMDSFFSKGSKKLPWEIFLNSFIQKSKIKFYVLSNQNYNWSNINYLSDFKNAKKIF